MKLFALSTLALIATPAFADRPALLAPGDTLLTVNAEGKAERAPDIAGFTAGITTIGASASATMTANAAAMTRVIAALKQAGIADRDIQTTELSLNPIYDNPTPGDAAPRRITGYRANDMVMARTRDIAAAGRIIDTLVGAGANEVSGPDFALDHPEAAMDEARAAAMASARARAELYARAAGLRVARIVAISESGGYQPVRPMMLMATRQAPATPIAPGDVSSAITLAVQFELAPR